MLSQPKSHQTTIRFSEELWQSLEVAAAELDVSIAQYVRDAARARLDRSAPPWSDQLPPALGREMGMARQAAEDLVTDSTALWEQGRQARLRAAQLRADATRQRNRRYQREREAGVFRSPERRGQ